MLYSGKLCVYMRFWTFLVVLSRFARLRTRLLFAASSDAVEPQSYDQASTHMLQGARHAKLAYGHVAPQRQRCGPWILDYLECGTCCPRILLLARLSKGPCTARPGAGKTHTMLGTEEDPGINFRTMRELFRCAAIREDQGSINT